MNLFVRERDPGFTYDMTEAEAEAAFPWLSEYWQTFGSFFARPPGGESLADVVGRVHTFLNTLFRDRAGQKVMVVTHGGTIRCFRFALERWGYEQASRWSTTRRPTAGSPPTARPQRRPARAGGLQPGVLDGGVGRGRHLIPARPRALPSADRAPSGRRCRAQCARRWGRAMHISFTVEPDQARARRAIQTTMGGKLLRLYILGAVVAAVGLVMFVNDIPSGAAPLVLGTGLLCFPWLVSRAAAQAKTGILGETATYELTDADVQAHTRSLNLGYRWESVQAVRETAEFWIVTVAGINPLVLPWTELPPAEAAEARAFLVGRGLLAGTREQTLGTLRPLGDSRRGDPSRGGAAARGDPPCGQRPAPARSRNGVSVRSARARKRSGPSS